MYFNLHKLLQQFVLVLIWYSIKMILSNKNVEELEDQLNLHKN